MKKLAIFTLCIVIMSLLLIGCAEKKISDTKENKIKDVPKTQDTAEKQNETGQQAVPDDENTGISDVFDDKGDIAPPPAP